MSLLKNLWAAVYSASEQATGAKTTTQEAKKLARENLQLMLHLNLLKIAEMHARDPGKLGLYMRQELLEDHPAGEEEEQPPRPARATDAVARGMEGRIAEDGCGG